MNLFEALMLIVDAVMCTALAIGFAGTHTNTGHLAALACVGALVLIAWKWRNQ